MNKPISPNNNATKPIVRYMMMSFYFVFIGFCAMGIWIKWDAIRYSGDDYSSHIYEEGFDAVSVTVPIPSGNTKLSFLQRLSRKVSAKPKPALVIQPERNITARQTWQKYAANTVAVPDNNAKVILVIDDLGIVKDVSKQMIDMDVPLTLSFLPYASDISAQVNDAYARGHDILVHIPMEPKGKAAKS